MNRSSRRRGSADSCASVAKTFFRMKGILNVAGRDAQLIFQGVHMIFDGTFGRAWSDESRSNRLVFIGRNLDQAELEAGFLACASPNSIHRMSLIEIVMDSRVAGVLPGRPLDTRRPRSCVRDSSRAGIVRVCRRWKSVLAGGGSSGRCTCCGRKSRRVPGRDGRSGRVRRVPRTGFAHRSVRPIAVDALGWVTRLVWSDDGEMVGAAVGRRLAVFSRHGEQVAAPHEHASTVSALIWHPVDRAWVTASYGAIAFVRAGEGEPIRRLHFRSSLLTADVSADGRFIASGTQDPLVHGWDLAEESAGSGVSRDTAGR